MADPWLGGQCAHAGRPTGRWCRARSPVETAGQEGSSRLISSRATVSMNFHRKGKHLYFGKERRRYVTPWSLGQI